MANSATFSLAVPWLTAVFLLSLRLATVFLMTPILYAIPMPSRVRALLVLGLSAAFAAGMPNSVLLTDFGPGELFVAACAEVALGATLALGILAAFGAIAVAGRLLDVQIGFGIAQVFDPVSRRQIPIINAAFNQLAVLVFFLINGHHALLRGIVYSLERFPLGMTWSPSAAALPVIKQIGGLFSIGFALAAPVVFCILMVEAALAVLSRAMPQMNIFMLGIPIKIVVGLIALSIWFAGIGGVMTKIYAGIFHTWEEIFATAGSIPQGGLP